MLVLLQQLLTAPRSAIDGHTTPESIANAFKDQYAAILRTNFVNLDQVNSFYHSLNIDCANKDYQIFHINEVFTACHQLKKTKKMLMNSSCLTLLGY